MYLSCENKPDDAKLCGACTALATFIYYSNPRSCIDFARGGQGAKMKKNKTKNKKKCLQTVDRRAGRVLIHMYIPFINMI